MSCILYRRRLLGVAFYGCCLVALAARSPDAAGQTHLKIFRKQCVMMAKIEDHMI
jgi:hypothetical protein